MSDWSLSTILATLHEDIQHRLRSVRATIAHPGSKGDGAENIWLDLLNKYLPERYRAAKASRRHLFRNAQHRKDIDTCRSRGSSGDRSVGGRDH